MNLSSALASAGLARVCELIGEVDERQSWMEDGATSLIDWVVAELLSNKTAQRIACDAVLESVLEEDGRVVGIGRRSRTVPGWLRRLVHERDVGKCQHPGCRHNRWLQVHHIVPWARGGPTDLDNLISLCSHHHRWVHERGWHITGPPDRRSFRRPDWTPHPTPRRDLDPRLRELVRSI